MQNFDDRYTFSYSYCEVVIVINFYCIIIIATGFCDAETVTTAGGTTFNWPETLGGEEAILVCPDNQDITITRRCDVERLWLAFDEDICNTFTGQLNILIDLFNNVRKLNSFISFNRGYIAIS